MRRDRTGEPLDDDEPDVPGPRHHCHGGWIDRNADRPIPCPTCRPWAAQRRPPTPDEYATARARQETP